MAEEAAETTLKSYVTLADFKRYLSTGSDEDTGNDPLREFFLEAATERVNEITGHEFGVGVDSTRHFTRIDWGRGSRGPRSRGIRPRIWFDKFLARITSLVVEGEEVEEDTYFLEPVDAPPYYCLQFRWDEWPSARLDTLRDNSIAVTGRWGYDIGVPKQIQLATMRLAAFYWREKDNEELNVIGDEETGQRVIAKSEPKYVHGLLLRYSQHRILQGVARL